jgi:hypothetical protein
VISLILAATISSAEPAQASACFAMIKPVVEIEFEAMPSLQSALAARGPLPAVPPTTEGILCRRDSIAPQEGDDGVITAYTVALYLVAGGRVGILEISNGQYRFRMIEGQATPEEKQLIQSRLNLFQARSQGEAD